MFTKNNCDWLNLNPAESPESAWHHKHTSTSIYHVLLEKTAKLMNHNVFVNQEGPDPCRMICFSIHSLAADVAGNLVTPTDELNTNCPSTLVLNYTCVQTLYSVTLKVKNLRHLFSHTTYSIG